MADCSKTEAYFATLLRMCRSGSCGECPYHNNLGRCNLLDGILEVHIPEVQAWADEHPPETWLDRALKLLPDLDEEEVTRKTCPSDLFGAAAKMTEGCDDHSGECPACWNEEAT